MLAVVSIRPYSEQGPWPSHCKRIPDCSRHLSMQQYTPKSGLIEGLVFEVLEYVMDLY
jgi:hypothetical protein